MGLTYVRKIHDKPLKNLVSTMLSNYGTEDTVIESHKVIDVLLSMLERKNQLKKDSEHYPQWVELLIAAGYTHNLFYDGTVMSLFKAREIIVPIAQTLELPVNAVSALCQTIEGQLGDRMPVESCIPADSTPNGLFSWACFFVEEYKGNKKIPNCRC